MAALMDPGREVPCRAFDLDRERDRGGLEIAHHIASWGALGARQPGETSGGPVITKQARVVKGAWRP